MFRKKLAQSFWGFIVEKHLVKFGISKINSLLRRQDCEYLFPQSFYDDAKLVLGNIANLKQYDLHSLNQYITKDLALQCHKCIEDLHGTGKYFQLNYSNPKLKIRAFDFTIGQYPIPEGYVQQTWLNSITYVIPKEEEEFQSHQRQQKLVDAAHKHGCHVEVKCSLECDLDWIVRDKASELVLLRDKSKEFEVSFLSPHFTPYDEIFTQNSDGTCKLNWDWKVCKFRKIS